jgi:hypothetical protein
VALRILIPSGWLGANPGGAIIKERAHVSSKQRRSPDGGFDLRAGSAHSRQTVARHEHGTAVVELLPGHGTTSIARQIRPTRDRCRRRHTAQVPLVRAGIGVRVPDAGQPFEHGGHIVVTGDAPSSEADPDEVAALRLRHGQPGEA